MKITKQILGLFLFFILWNTTQNVSAQTTNAKVGTMAIGAADGVAVWIHPDDPSKSMIIGADPGKGLGTFNLDGSLIQVVNFGIGGAGEVDVRYNFPLGGEKYPSSSVQITNRIFSGYSKLIRLHGYWKKSPGMKYPLKLLHMEAVCIIVRKPENFMCLLHQGRD